jgi:hypothetical protein
MAWFYKNLNQYAQRKLSTQAANFCASASLTWGFAGIGTTPQTPAPPF